MYKYFIFAVAMATTIACSTTSADTEATVVDSIAADTSAIIDSVATVVDSTLADTIK